MSMDPAKVKAVHEWNTPKNVKDVQAFLAFANFYHHFILGFSKVANPLTQLTRKDLAFQWTPETQRAFQTLKEALTTASILAHFDPDKEILVETDTSDYLSTGILSNTTTKTFYDQSPIFPKNIHPRSSTMKYMTKNYWPSSVLSKNGDPNWKGPPTPSQYSPTTKI